MVWMGRDDNGKTPFTGATGALQVWTSFMRKADPLPLDMAMPDNVVQRVRLGRQLPECSADAVYSRQ